MQKMLTKHVNSLALIIDRPILDLFHIDASTPLDISTDGQVLIIAPTKDEKRAKKFQEALGRANEKYGRALKRLAE